jgi:hypothetical protein
VHKIIPETPHFALTFENTSSGDKNIRTVTIMSKNNVINVLGIVALIAGAVVAFYVCDNGITEYSKTMQTDSNGTTAQATISWKDQGRNHFFVIQFVYNNQVVKKQLNVFESYWGSKHRGDVVTIKFNPTDPNYVLLVDDGLEKRMAFMPLISGILIGGFYILLFVVTVIAYFQKRLTWKPE